MYYCPKCNKIEINFDSSKHKEEETVFNIRDGYGSPIQHYLCECGNPLAGDMDTRRLTRGKPIDEEAIEYAKEIITGYNEGGMYFDQKFFDYATKIANKEIV